MITVITWSKGKNSVRFEFDGSEHVALINVEGNDTTQIVANVDLPTFGKEVTKILGIELAVRALAEYTKNLGRELRRLMIATRSFGQTQKVARKKVNAKAKKTKKTKKSKPKKKAAKKATKKTKKVAKKATKKPAKKAPAKRKPAVKKAEESTESTD